MYDMKEMTAVEWLVDMLIDNKYLLKDAEHLFNQAKQMEKEQIMNAVDYGPDYNKAEDYYNKTYKSE
jgi:hypothetical protein